MSVQEQLKNLRDERSKVRTAMTVMVEDKFEATKEQVGDKPVMISQSFNAEEKEQYDRLIAEWDTIEAGIKVLDGQQDRDRIEAEKEDLYGGLTAEAQKRAKLNAEFYQNLVKVGHNQYTAARKDVAPQGHPGELVLPTPAILKGEDGKNRVHPFPAVYNESEENDLINLEATFRNAEMIKAGVQHQYNPLTGNRLEAAADPILTTDVPAAIPDLSVDLYRYMITRNELAMYAKIYQTSGLNDLPIQRRTGVPRAVIVGNNTNYGQNTDLTDLQSDFSEFTLKAFKYGFLSQYSWESAMTVQPWSVAATVAEDGGIGLANGFGEHVFKGAGGNTEPTGILTAIKADTNQQVNGVAAATAFTGARADRTFTIDEFTGFVANLPIPYFRAQNKMMICNLAPWAALLSVTDTNGQPIFNADMNINEMTLPKFGLKVALEPGAESHNTAGHYPFIVGDLSCHAVRYAGPVRIAFSDEYGFSKDLLTYKFVSYADSNQIDPNAFRGYKLS